MMRTRRNLHFSLIGWCVALSTISLAAYASLAGDRSPVMSGPVPEQTGLNVTHDDPTKGPDIEEAQEVG